jgi:hypothetical protein
MDDYTYFTSGHALQDEETGIIRIRNTDFGTDEIAIWPHSAKSLGEWLQDRSRVETGLFVYYRESHKDHIVENGDTVCSHRVNVPCPNSEDLKPFSDVTPREWQLLQDGMDLCIQCYGVASRNDYWPDVSAEDPEEFPCPECGDPATSINTGMGGTRAEHSDGRIHEIDYSQFRDWRRGKTDEN